MCCIYNFNQLEQSIIKIKSEEIALMKKNSNETNISGHPSIIKNFTPGTPVNLLEQKKFIFDKCVVDGLYFNNKEEIYEAKCGHLYHKNSIKNGQGR